MIELEEQTRSVLIRLKTNGATSDDFIASDKVRWDVCDDWVPGMMANPVPHEEDYKVFGHFKDPMSVVLDVGANRGYSVASLRSVGCMAQISSFEVSEAHRSSLSLVKKIEGDRYSYRIVGVGSSKRVVDFFTPVVNGVTLSALTFGDLSAIHVDSLVKNVISYACNYIDGPSYEVKILRLPAAIDRVDDMVSSDANIVAAKLDVEGFEVECLRGSIHTLERCKPLLMIEGGNFNPEIEAFLAGKSYIMAERVSSCLSKPVGRPTGANGFFVSLEKIDHYAANGLWSVR